MSKFFIEQEVTRIDFPDGQWVDVKTEFTQEDMDFIANEMMKARVTTIAKESPETELSMVFGKQATLERAIVAWGFIDESEKPIPITPENISNLRSKYRFVILKEIDRLSNQAGQFLKN